MITTLLLLALHATVDYHWRALPIDGGGAISCLAVSPHDAAALLTGGPGSGVHRSTDGGRSWTPASTGLAGGARWVVGLAFHRTDAQRVFAATGGGLLVSVDAGTSWAPLARELRFGADGPTRQSSHVLAVEPLDPSHLWAATTDRGVLWSGDAGLTWSELGPRGRCALALARQPDGTLHVAITATAQEPAGVWRRRPGDARWLPVYDGPVLDLAVGVEPPVRILLATADRGLLLSEDGLPWRTVTPAGYDPRAGSPCVVFAPSHPRVGVATVAAASGGRRAPVWLTLDGGRTWQGMVEPGLRHVDAGTGWLEPAQLGARARCAAFDPRSPRRVWLGDAFAVWGTHDGAATWFCGASGLRTATVRALSLDPRGPDTVYAGTDTIGAFQADLEPAFATALGGNALTVTQVNGIAARRTATGTRVLISHGPTLWRQEQPGRWTTGAEVAGLLGALRLTPDDGLLATVGGGVPLLTRDDGDTWQPWADQPLREVAFLDDLGRQRAALTTDGRVVLSLDGGARYERIDAELPPDSPWTAPTDLAALPGGALFAGGPAGVWRSTDRGRRWERVLERPVGLLAAEAGVRRLWAAAAPGAGLWTTPDLGETWNEPTGTPPAPITALAVDSRRPGRVWLGLAHGGLWVGDTRP